MINTCIFDLDGTLVDSLLDLANATNKMLEDYGFPIHDIKEYQWFVGDGVNKLIERALPSGKKELVAKARLVFDNYYQSSYLNNTKPYEGILDLIKELKGKQINLAVVTNKPSTIASRIVSELFGDSFTYVYGNNGKDPLKPDPTLTNQVINLLEVDKDNVVFIGDSDVDIYTANNAQIKSIGVSWGFRGKQELLNCGANYVVNTVEELRRIIYDWRE